jgi:hypothetical protein
MRQKNGSRKRVASDVENMKSFWLKRGENESRKPSIIFQESIFSHIANKSTLLAIV